MSVDVIGTPPHGIFKSVELLLDTSLKQTARQGTYGAACNQLCQGPDGRGREGLRQVQVQSDIGARLALARPVLRQLRLQALCGAGPQRRIDQGAGCRDASTLNQLQDRVNGARVDGEIICASDPVARIGAWQWRSAADHRGGTDSDAIGVSIGLAPKRRATI